MTSRRTLLGAAVAAGAAGAPVPRKTIRENDPGNMRISHRVSARATDEELEYLQGIGLRWARLEVPFDAELPELERARDRFARYGIGFSSCAHYAHRQPDIQLGRPGVSRDRALEKCKAMIRELGRLKVPILVLDWHPANTYTTAMVRQNGYVAREFSVADFRAKMDKRIFDRDYSAEEVWAGFTHYLKTVLPVAEEANVKLAMHPDDPPIAVMHGVGRIFINYECYRRAEQLAGASKHFGVRLCVGTWAEGGAAMGKDVFGMIRDFGARGKIFDVDFRNVSSPLPRFVECFPDDGYMDMYQVMKALREVRYSGPIVPDHLPELAGDTGIRRGATAYSIAWLRSLLRRANEEVG